MDTISRFDARHSHERNYLKKIFERFAQQKVCHQDGSRMYGIFSTVLDFVLTNEQKLKALGKENCVLKKCIDDMVSLFMQVYCDIFQLILTVVFPS